MANFQKVTKGAIFDPSATEWNAMLDAARARKDHQHDRRAPESREFRQADIIRVENNSGYDVDRFGVLGIDGPRFTPDENLTEFSNRIVLKGTTPALPDHRGRFVVCLEPIADGKIGRAWVSGTCQARVDLVNDEHQFCEALGDDRSHLVSCHDGSARILWHEDRDGSGGSSNGLAIIRIGDPAPRLWVGRFAGTWNKFETKTVDVCVKDGSTYIPIEPAETAEVWNGAADVETPDEESYGFLGFSERGGGKVVDWFECDVAEEGSGS
jgi:hypothetical protein